MSTHVAQNDDLLPSALVDGYHAFAGGRLRDEQERFRQLAKEGQRPPVLLISCCDSRVAPEAIFDAGPGEIFVVRNIANLVPPYASKAGGETAAAIEYAVIALKVAHIVVMGHAKCGGIRAHALDHESKFQPLSSADFVGQWKALIRPAVERLGPPTADLDDYCERLCHSSIMQGLDNLRTYPFVQERQAAGELTLHGAYFGVADGALAVLDQAQGTFIRLPLK